MSMHDRSTLGKRPMECGQSVGNTYRYCRSAVNLGEILFRKFQCRGHQVEALRTFLLLPTTMRSSSSDALAL